jgi:hypothetical protein
MAQMGNQTGNEIGLESHNFVKTNKQKHTDLGDLSSGQQSLPHVLFVPNPPLSRNEKPQCDGFRRHWWAC